LLLTNRRLIRVTPKTGAESSSASKPAPSKAASSDSKKRAGGKAESKQQVPSAATDSVVVDVSRSDIVRVTHAHGGTFADDTLSVSLWDRNTITVSVFSESAAAFFTKILEESIRAKHHAPPDFNKFEVYHLCLALRIRLHQLIIRHPLPAQIPKAVRYGRLLEQYKIMKNLQTHKLLTVYTRSYGYERSAEAVIGH
jgi:hypothetical protein